MYLLGIDAGTSSVKVVLVDAATGDLLDHAAEEYPIYYPQPAMAEQDPRDWWRATVRCIRRIMADRRGIVAAIGFSGQMHGTILTDAQGETLGNAIIWADQRSAEMCPALLEMVGAETFVQTTGTRPAAGFMVATLLWLQRNQPERLREARYVMLPKDYLRCRLTGAIATDYSDAAGTGLFDIRARTWAERIVDVLGIDPDLLPAAQESYGVAGHLLPEVAALLDLPAGIPVVMGCADQPAQAVGNAILDPGIASITIGSGGQVFLPVAESGSLRTDPRLHVFNHAAPGWYALGAILAAGLALRWLRGITGLQDNPDAYPILSAEAAATPAGELLFLPYLSGERTPHLDPYARGGFIGLASHHTRGHLARAVMEGVTFALRQSLEICETVGQPAKTIIAAGGGGTSPFWLQLIADVLNRPVSRSRQQEQAGVGAALLAGIGAGIYGSTPKAGFDVVRERSARYEPEVEPVQTQVARYEERYQQYVSLYGKLAEDFHQLVR